MRTKPLLLVGAVAVFAVAGAVLWRSQSRQSTRDEPIALATPSGITLVSAFAAGGKSPPALQKPIGIAFGNAEGFVLYTYGKDTEPGRSACTGECAKTWQPALADANNAPTGDWSLITREDGAKQWTWRGKPLYRYADDRKAGVTEVAARASNRVKPGADQKQVSADAVSPDWHLALFNPTDGVAFPYGISATEVSDAGGQVLVDDRGMTLYTYDGDLALDKSTCAGPPCSNHWVPVAAPELGNRVGDFSVATRDDGLRLWTFKGKPLYRYDGDLESGDAAGIGVDRRWQPAMLARYFTPGEIGVGHLIGRGSIFVTKDNMTIYRRDGYEQQVGGHGLRHGVPIRPAVGRDIGTKTCDAECFKSWRPLAAPSGAQASGFWEILVAADGTRQWSYKGYALYTYTGDKRPGDVNGNDIYDIIVSSDPQKVAAPPVFMHAGGKESAGALFWTYAFP